MKEVWKDIVGYEGLYQVSNLGRARSLPRPVGDGTNRMWKGRVLRATDNGRGYKIVGLRRNNIRKNYYVHRLVAQHFLDGWNELLVVDHIDGNKENNSVENLRIVSQKENVSYAIHQMRKPHKSWKGDAEKYIYERGGRYRVCMPKMPEKSFSTMEEAIEYKNMVLSKKKHGRNYLDE